MQPPEAIPAMRSQRWLVRLVYGLAAVLGMLSSYDFGQTIGGPWVGVMLALNGAIFCSIVAGALAEKLCQWWPSAQRPRRPSAN
jgi:hypothetical protein